MRNIVIVEQPLPRPPQAGAQETTPHELFIMPGKCFLQRRDKKGKSDEGWGRREERKEGMGSDETVSTEMQWLC